MANTQQQTSLFETFPRLVLIMQLSHFAAKLPVKVHAVLRLSPLTFFFFLKQCAHTQIIWIQNVVFEAQLKPHFLSACCVDVHVRPLESSELWWLELSL